MRSGGTKAPSAGSGTASPFASIVIAALPAGPALSVNRLLDEFLPR